MSPLFNRGGQDDGHGRDREDARDPGTSEDPGRDAGPGGGTDPRLIPDLRVEPIRAWKQARLVYENGVYRFGGIGYTHTRYGVEGAAECSAGEGNGWLSGLFSQSYSFQFTTSSGGLISVPTKVEPKPAARDKHAAPDAECRCGFYALPDKPAPHPTYACLEIELFGRVIEHERGYRAEKQRVLGATIARDAIAPTCQAKKCVGLERPAWFIRCHDGALRCARHVVKSRYRFAACEFADAADALRRDLSTEWHFA